MDAWLDAWLHARTMASKLWNVRVTAWSVGCWLCVFDEKGTHQNLSHSLRLTACFAAESQPASTYAERVPKQMLSNMSELRQVEDLSFYCNAKFGHDAGCCSSFLLMLTCIGRLSGGACDS